MLSQERISAGKLKQAYDLNDREVEELLRTLWPDHIFPFQLWNEARKTFWFGAYDFYMDRFKVKNFNDCEHDLAVSDDFFFTQ